MHFDGPVENNQNNNSSTAIQNTAYATTTTSSIRDNYSSSASTSNAASVVSNDYAADSLDSLNLLMQDFQSILLRLQNTAQLFPKAVFGNAIVVPMTRVNICCFVCCKCYYIRLLLELTFACFYLLCR